MAMHRRKRRVVRKKCAVRRPAKHRKMPAHPGKKVSAVSRAKKVIRKHADDMLKDGLYQRDCAKTAKQHKAAQKKIAAARKELKRFA